MKFPIGFLAILLSLASVEVFAQETINEAAKTESQKLKTDIANGQAPKVPAKDKKNEEERRKDREAALKNSRNIRNEATMKGSVSAKKRHRHHAPPR